MNGLGSCAICEARDCGCTNCDIVPTLLVLGGKVAREYGVAKPETERRRTRGCIAWIFYV